MKPPTYAEPLIIHRMHASTEGTGRRRKEIIIFDLSDGTRWKVWDHDMAVVARDGWEKHDKVFICEACMDIPVDRMVNITRSQESVAEEIEVMQTE